MNADQLAELDDEKAKKRKQRAAEMRRRNDIEWGELQRDNEKHIKSGDLFNVLSAQYRMAMICESEQRWRDCLRHWSCVFTLELNGADFRGWEAPSKCWFRDLNDTENLLSRVGVFRAVHAFQSAINDGHETWEGAEQTFLRFAGQFDSFDPPILDSQAAWEALKALILRTEAD